jgi:hypothetical protein
MVFSGILRRLALVRTDVAEERSASFIAVARIGELGTTLAVTSIIHMLRRNVFLSSARRLRVKPSVVPSSQILATLMKEALSSSDTSVLIRATRRNTPADTILRSHRRENMKNLTSFCFMFFYFPLIFFRSKPISSPPSFCVFLSLHFFLIYISTLRLNPLSEDSNVDTRVYLALSCTHWVGILIMLQSGYSC